MKLKPGFEEEYKRRHDEIWPELQEVLREAGIRTYSIFLDEDSLTLFAIQIREDQHDEEAVASHPVTQKWWDYMAPLMETNADQSPATTSLREVFRLET